MSTAQLAADYLSPQEIRYFRTASDWRALAGFAVTWSMILAAMAWASLQPGLLSTSVALLILSNRQLALGILLHECSHRSWFSRETLNDFMGHWLAGIPVMVPLAFYRQSHFSHHRHTGGEHDPDVENIRQYPVSAASWRRKLWRDFSGQSGLKNLIGLWRTVLGNRAGNGVSMGLQKDESPSRKRAQRSAWQNYRDFLCFHAAFVLMSLSLGWMTGYVLWWLAFIFVYPFIIRVRQAAEHGAMPLLSSADVRDTTRTTLTPAWARLVFAPHYVNYHCEHHLLPTVPAYRLPRLHRLLKSRGFYREHPDTLARNYSEVLQRLKSSQA